MIGSFASLGILRWLAMPGGQTFVTSGIIIAGVIAFGWWLRWDARADATRTVIERVVKKHDTENKKLLREVESKHQALTTAVWEARQELEHRNGEFAEMEVKLAQAEQKIIEREARLTAALKKVGLADQSYKCGLTQEEINIGNN